MSSQPQYPARGPRPPQTPPVRRLQSPAERFGPPSVEIDANLSAPHAIPIEPSGTEPQNEATPDPFQPLPDARRPVSRPAPRSRAARRVPKPHAPRVHEKRPHQVAHLQINPSPAPDSHDEKARNSMARALITRKKARVRRIVRRVLGVAAILFVAQCAVAALTAPQFQVKAVEVRGLSETPAAPVEKLAATLVGQNVFRAPRAALLRKVEAIPTVAHAQLVRSWQWPPQMRLEVTERQPILRVGAGNSWWVADAQGVPYRRAHKGDESLYALAAPQFAPQTGKALPAADWKRARELTLALQSDNALAKQNSSGAPQFWQLRRLYLDRDGFAAVRVSGGAHRELLIRLGEEDWASKLAQARVALAYFERTGQRARELDLVSGEHPRWRPLDKVAGAQELAAGVG